MLNVANWNDDTDTYVLCYIICPWLALAKKRSPETFKTFLGYAFVLGMTVPVMQGLKMFWGKQLGVPAVSTQFSIFKMGEF